MPTDTHRCKCKPNVIYKLLKPSHNRRRPNGAVVTRLTRNEKIIGSIPILGIELSFGMDLTFWMSHM